MKKLRFILVLIMISSLISITISITSSGCEKQEQPIVQEIELDSIQLEMLGFANYCLEMHMERAPDTIDLRRYQEQGGWKYYIKHIYIK